MTPFDKGCLQLQGKWKSRLHRNFNTARRGVVAIRKRLHEGDKLIFFMVGQVKIADRFVEVPAGVGRRKTVDIEAFAGASLAGLHLIFVSGVIEVDNFLQTLEVPVMHVGFDECMRRQAGPEIHVP